MMRAHYQKNHAHTRSIYRDRVDLATMSRSQTSIIIVLDGYLHAKCVQMLFPSRKSIYPPDVWHI